MLLFDMHLIINGQPREFAALMDGSTLEQLVTELQLKGDRVAIEKNGEIVPRSQWQTALLAEADKLELVHFVGGGVEAGAVDLATPGRNHDQHWCLIAS